MCRSVRHRPAAPIRTTTSRSEEHTSELQSPSNLVCRLLLEKKKQPASPLHPLVFDAIDGDLCQVHRDGTVPPCRSQVVRPPSRSAPPPCERQAALVARTAGG